MFGCYRTLLAAMVVLLHVGGLAYMGEYAVYGFFGLSGYLITMVMQRSYGYSVKGRLGFAANRFLRIYPVYWAACLLSIVVLLVLDPEYTTIPNRNYWIPTRLIDWVKNLGLLLRPGLGPYLIAPAWALTIELLYYACIGIGFSRSKRLTLIWFLVSAAYTAYMIVSGWSWEIRYFGMLSASLPFSTGALIYHWREQLLSGLGKFADQSGLPVLIFLLVPLNWVVGTYFGTQSTWSFYINFLLCSAMIPILCAQKSLFFVSKKVDSAIGDFSYPIYLVHVPVAVVVAYGLQTTGLERPDPGILMLTASAVPILFFSWLLTFLVERPVELVRSLVKRTVGAAPSV